MGTGVHHMFAGSMGVAVDQCVGAQTAQPVAGGLRIHIGVGSARMFTCIAVVTQAAGNLLALGQGFGQKLGLPSETANLLTKQLVLGVI